MSPCECVSKLECISSGFSLGDREVGWDRGDSGVATLFLERVGWAVGGDVGGGKERLIADDGVFGVVG